ncbi:MAG TPA: hypothetical protein VF310_08365, partial [Vicinamibacteria bacterium]
MRRALALLVLAAAGPAARPALADSAREGRLRAHLEFLASDALNGRAGGSRDELVACLYAAAQLRALGIEPAGDEGGYLQRVVLGGDPPKSTWNVLGRLPGSDPAAARRAVLLSAHIDHLGARDGAGGDRIFNGA